MSKRLLPPLLACALLAACGDQPAPKADAPTPIVQGNRLRFVADHPQLRLLTLATTSAAQPVRVELPAKLVWNEERTQRIYSPFAARVVAIKADIGQRVGPGAALAQLASPDFGQVQSDAVRAQADARQAAQTLQRQRELFEAGIVARKELEQAETDDERARAELDRTRERTRLYGAGNQVNQQLHLAAAITGIVVERNINPGQELRPDLGGPGMPPLFVVSDPSSLWLQIDARESEIGVVRPGQRFELRVAALPGQSFEGRVIASTDFIDPQTRTIKVRASVANRQRLLKAEMLATAVFERRFEGHLVVPATSVLLQGSLHQVFVQTRPGEFEPREVTLAYEGSRDVVIASGLQPGELVVSENALLLARQFRLAQGEARARPETSSANGPRP